MTVDTRLNNKKKSILLTSFKQGFNKTWKMTNYVVVSLERIGQNVDSIPKQSSTGKSQHQYSDPSNLASGLATGTHSMLKNVFSAVAGVVIEPVKGAK